jgi:lipopolysaccharide export system protein LptC
MAERRTWIVVILLAVLAGLSQWLLWIFTPEPEAPPFIGPLRPEYSLDNFQLRVFKDNGQLSFEVESPRMDRHGGDGHFLVREPEMIILREGEPQWQASSTDSRIEANGNQLELRGGVRFHSMPDDPRPIDIRTEHLLAFPDTQRAQTDVPVTVVQGRSILRGSGMRADFATSQLHLDDFRLHSPPTR